MAGILKIAYELLVNDRTKFAALRVGVTFAYFSNVRDDLAVYGVLRLRPSSAWTHEPVGGREMIAGNIRDIFAESAFITIRDSEF
jgi:hypothetical protein